MAREEIFYELMETIYEMSRLVYPYDSKSRKYGIEEELFMVEAHTINVIGINKQTNVTQLAKLTHKTKGAVSQMIDKLIKKGMVKKYKNPDNNREVILELTEKGKKVYEYHKDLDKVEYNKMLDKLDEFSEEDFLKYIKINLKMIKMSRKSKE